MNRILVLNTSFSCSLILAPLVGSFDIVVPMMAGRGLGHTGGTIDKLESIPGYRTQYTSEEFAKLLLTSTDGSEDSRLNAAIVSPSKSMCPADKRMYALRVCLYKYHPSCPKR
jgi:thymidine phosphorylase